MDNKVSWLIPKRVIFFSMKGDVDLAIFSKINAEAEVLIAAGEAPVHILADIRDLKSLSMSVRWIARNAPIRGEKVGFVFVIGVRGYFVFTTKAVKLITKSRIQSFNTITEAYHALSQADSSLPQRLG